MGYLIDQFVDVIDKWSEKTQSRLEDVTTLVMSKTGRALSFGHEVPFGQEAPVYLEFMDRVEHDAAVDVAPTLRYADIHLSLPTTKLWLEKLVTHVGVREDFLITSLISMYEAHLAEDARRADAVSTFIEEFATLTDRHGAGDAESLPGFQLERSKVRTKAYLLLDLWCEITGPIIAKENLRRYQVEQRTRIRE